jgi:outer membrane protein assembly factor BamB
VAARYRFSNDVAAILWSIAGDGMLTIAPVVANSYVFVRSSSGNLYALDATSGAQLWLKDLGHPISPSPFNSA